MKTLWQSLLSRSLYAFSYLLLKTCKIDIQGLERYLSLVEKEGGILAFWHESLFLAPYFVASICPKIPCTAVLSKSRDAQLLAMIANRFENGNVYLIAHNKRAVALKELLKLLQEGRILIITPDGPRGPAKKAKDGLFFLARKSKKWVYPLSWTASSFWRLPSWDAFKIPMPFSRISLKLSEPLRLESLKEKQSFEELLNHSLEA